MFLESRVWKCWSAGMVFFIPVRGGLTGFFSIMWVLLFYLHGLFTWFFTPGERWAHRGFFQHFGVFIKM